MPNKTKNMTKPDHPNPFILLPEQVWAFRRRTRERTFRRCGLAAILISLLFLGSMGFNIIAQGYSAFMQVELRLPVEYPAPEGTDERLIVQNALYALFPEVTTHEEKRQLGRLISRGAYYELRDEIEDKSITFTPGTKRDIWLPASSIVDLQIKRFNLDEENKNSKLNNLQLNWLKTLENENRIRTSFNTTFFSGGDAQEAEQAGALGSMMGSLFTILVCIACAFPLGVATALYLEEFARDNWFTNLVEININNLAAVPSIIYGLLGLSIYINWIGLPRSSALVGGLVLALLVLPVIVIATRNALRSVPKDIRYAAMALGATPVQVSLQHTLPYALPGIMTGLILSIARALGETSPLLMIGMVAFVTDVPRKIVDPATTLPVQIYLWTNNPDAGFVEKTAAIIIILLVCLAIINVLAAWVRRRFEIKW